MGEDSEEQKIYIALFAIIFLALLPPSTALSGSDWDSSSYDFQDKRQEAISSPSGDADPPPAPPQSVSASDGEYNDKIRITWSVVFNAVEYKIFRATSDGGTKTLIGSTGDTTWDDFDCTLGQIYYYWIRASNGSKNSGFSPHDTGYRGDIPNQDCIPDENTLCLNNERFKVQVAWESEQGGAGNGHAVPYGSDDSGMFWFFSSGNLEMLVKVLNGCGYNDRFWVFFAATTDQEFAVTVTEFLLVFTKIEGPTLLPVCRSRPDRHRPL